MNRPTLNIIGTGKLGSVMGALLVDSGAATPGFLFNRTAARAVAARDFIGQGTATDRLDDLAPADIWLIATADDAIAGMAERLAVLQLPWRDTVVFHCSGIHSSGLLAPLAARGATTASIHPAHSFADSEKSRRDFGGTWCTLEGDEIALNRLEPLVHRLHARTLRIDAEYKTLYHAATAIASNHLVAMIGGALELLEKAGIAPEIAKQLLTPLVTNSCKNLFADGATKALTGPVARGDANTVRLHMEALGAQQPALLPGYKAMTAQCLQLVSAANRNAGHERIESLLDDSSQV